MNWSRKRVIVTGGAGFIGGAMVDALLGRGASATVVDKPLFPSNVSWERKFQRWYFAA